MSRSISAVTYNVGLLSIFTKNLIPLARERAILLPNVIASFVDQEKVDIIVFQELWNEKDAVVLQGILNRRGFQTRRPPRLGIMGSGMLIAIRSPLSILSCAFVPFLTSASSDQLARKGMMVANIGTADGETFTFVGTHLQALHTKNGVPSHRAEIRAHQQQVTQMDRYLKSDMVDQKNPVLTLGDFNVGPGYIEECFEFIHESCGFRMPYQGFQGHTWDKDNVLVSEGFNAKEPSALIDHCFIGDGEKLFWKEQSAAVVMNDPHPTLSYRTKAAPLSDHYGLKVDLILASA